MIQAGEDKLSNIPSRNLVDDDGARRVIVMIIRRERERERERESD